MYKNFNNKILINIKYIDKIYIFRINKKYNDFKIIL